MGAWAGQPNIGGMQPQQQGGDVPPFDLPPPPQMPMPGGQGPAPQMPFQGGMPPHQRIPMPRGPAPRPAPGGQGPMQGGDRIFRDAGIGYGPNDGGPMPPRPPMRPYPIPHMDERMELMDGQGITPFPGQPITEYADPFGGQPPMPSMDPQVMDALRLAQMNQGQQQTRPPMGPGQDPNQIMNILRSLGIV